MRVFVPEVVFGGPGDPPSGGGAGEIPASSIPDASGVDETANFVADAFQNMGIDDSEDETSDPALTEDNPPATEEPATAPTTAAPKAPPQTTPAQTQPPTDPRQATPPPTPPAQAPAAAPSAQQPPAIADSPDKVFERISQQVFENQQAFAAQLAETYMPSPEDVERFNTEPARVMAEIAGRVQAQTTASIMQVLHRQMGAFVGATLETRMANERAEDAFWQANPGLNRNEHRAVVAQLANWHQTAYPNVPAAERMAVVGRMAQAQLGLVHQAMQDASRQPGGTTSRVAIQAPGRVVRNVSPPSPIPGMNGAAPSAHPAPARSQWDLMTEFMSRDDF